MSQSPVDVLPVIDEPVVTGGARLQRTLLQRTLHRRRVLLAALLVAAFVSLALAFVAREGSMWGVHAATDTVLVSYIGLLIHVRNANAEQEMTRRALRGS